MKGVARRILERVVDRYGYKLVRDLPPPPPDLNLYDQDGLRSIHNHDFMKDPEFVRAYGRGLQAHYGVDHHVHWRAHVVLWVAHCASQLPGDFVECGVNWGFMSSCVLEYLDWNARDKSFYLLDTFNGMDRRFLTEEEVGLGKWEHNEKLLAAGSYEVSIDARRAHFAQWDRVHLVQGAVPETLPQVDAPRVAYLHLDMNCSLPERAACEYFWPRLVPGGMILLDDYGWRSYETQKATHDAFAAERGVTILALPTGQGLMVKPAV
ncbi:MAG TPA: TylF/MycF/NovP-related O-methyltransferase [Vicinamibacteria bacterium]